MIIGIISVVVIARLIGPEAFGLAAIGLGLTLVLGVFINSLVHDGLVRSERYSDRHLDSAISFSLLAGIVAALGLALAARPLALFLEQPRLVPVLLAFLPMLLFGGVSAPLIAERRRLLDFRAVGRHQVLSRISGLVVGIAVAVAGGGAWSVVAQQLVTTGLLALTLALTRPMLPRLGIDWKALRPILVFSQYIAWTQLVIQATERIFLVTVGYLYGLAAAGQWAVATRLFEALATAVLQVVYHVALAHLAALRDDRRRLGGLAAFNGDLLMLVMLPCFAGLAAAAEPVIGLLFGDEWIAVARLVVWLLLGGLFVLRRLMTQVALNVLGRSHVSLIAVAAENATALVLLVVATPLGVVGAAAARGIAFVVGWLVMARDGARALGLSVLRELLQAGLDLAASVAIVASTIVLLDHLEIRSPLLDSALHAGMAGGLMLLALAAARPHVPLGLLAQLRARP